MPDDAIRLEKMRAYGKKHYQLNKEAIIKHNKENTCKRNKRINLIFRLWKTGRFIVDDETVAEIEAEFETINKNYAKIVFVDD